MWRAMQSTGFAQPLTHRFSQIFATCPLCGAPDIAYEFAITGVAYSRCRACSLLFANPTPPPAALPLTADARAMVSSAVRLAERYAGSRPLRSAIVGYIENPAVENLSVLSPVDLENEDAPFDLIVALGGIERAPDPYEFLQRVKNKLHAHGILALLYPSLSSRTARLRWDQWIAFHAKLGFLFTPDTVQLLATRCGYGDFLSFVDSRDVGSGDDREIRRWFETGALTLCRPLARQNTGLLSVIFPVYNERATVEESLRRVLKKEIPGVHIEIIIVESNSTDGSRDIVEHYRSHPRVHLVHEDAPRGKGHAIRTGLQHASGEVILFQDADLEYDVADYDALVAPLFEMKRNFVLGSRHDARGTGWKIRHFADQPGLSNATNLAHRCFLSMFNSLYGQLLRDPFTMYKVFRRDCLYGLSFECNRFDFDFEITIKLIRKGYHPVELPVNYESRSFREGKKVSILRDPPTWIRAMFKMRRACLYEEVGKPFADE